MVQNPPSPKWRFASLYIIYKKRLADTLRHRTLICTSYSHCFGIKQYNLSGYSCTTYCFSQTGESIVVCLYWMYMSNFTSIYSNIYLKPLEYLELTFFFCCSYLHDVIYITSFVQIMSILSGKFWWTYLVVRFGETHFFYAFHMTGGLSVWISMSLIFVNSTTQVTICSLHSIELTINRIRKCSWN